ncbi:MAG TPA: hypothetical protein DD729_01240 [Rhodobacteraceae bacterium]|jgi:hypothetical protein|nr:hypothetical protein [Paracoccaceae bacterium]
MKILLLPLLLLGTPVFAADPVIKSVTAQKSGSNWSFSVSLKHPDTGWDHYADGWEVLDADGKRLGYRQLMHPHVNEQPFTRSLSGVSIPPDTDKVFIRAHCLVDGWGKQLFEVDLKR